MIINDRRALKNTVDLHGLAFDEALSDVEAELNHTFCQEQGDRRIDFITGWGAVLRPRLIKYFTDHELVKEIEILGPILRVHLEDIA